MYRAWVRFHLGIDGSSLFSILVECQTLQTISHTHQPCMRILVSPEPSCYLPLGVWACGRECAPMSACAPSFHPVLPCFCLCWARLARKLPSSWSSLLSQIFPCQHTAGTATCTIMLYGFHGVGINLRLSVFYPLLSWSPDIPVKCPTIELQLFLNYNSFSGFYFYFPNVSNVGRVYFMCFFWGRGTINISFH